MNTTAQFEQLSEAALERVSGGNDGGAAPDAPVDKKVARAKDAPAREPESFGGGRSGGGGAGSSW
jgi:uncharacterized membrane protein YgcG